MYRLIFLAICIAANTCYAQELQLTNTGQYTVVMKYLSTSKRPSKMSESRVSPSPNGKVTARVRLYDSDPYDVSFYLEPITTDAGTSKVFHAKVGRPIPLRELSSQGVFDVSLVLAANQRQGRTIYQASGAALQSGNRRVNVYSSPSSASDFTRNVIKQRWDTTFKAGNGNVDRATVDFDKLTFRTATFAGSFTDLAIFEDDRGCHIVGEWAALDSSGDVFFTIDRSSPTKLNGDYTFRGEKQRYFWRSQ